MMKFFSFFNVHTLYIKLLKHYNLQSFITYLILSQCSFQIKSFTNYYTTQIFYNFKIVTCKHAFCHYKTSAHEFTYLPMKCPLFALFKENFAHKALPNHIYTLNNVFTNKFTSKYNQKLT